MDKSTDFIYCFNRECTLNCARNDKHVERGVIYLREQYKQDKNGKCVHFLSVKEEMA